MGVKDRGFYGTFSKILLIKYALIPSHLGKREPRQIFPGFKLLTSDEQTSICYFWCQVSRRQLDVADVIWAWTDVRLLLRVTQKHALARCCWRRRRRREHVAANVKWADVSLLLLTSHEQKSACPSWHHMILRYLVVSNVKITDFRMLLLTSHEQTSASVADGTWADVR